MPPSEDKSYIEELKKSLYSREAPDIRTRRKLRYDDSGSNLPTDWGKNNEEIPEPVLNQQYENHKMSFATKFLIASIIFCIIAVGIGAYLFFNGANLISANNIAINISGPVSIAGGEPVSFDINVINQNNVDLQLVDMTVIFPDGSTDPNDSTKTLQNYTHLIGDLPAGGSSKQTISAIVFGEENTQKEIKVNLTYGVKGSTAVFTKTQSYDVLLSSSPINISVSTFKEVTSGQQFDIKVKVKSNSKETLKNVVLKATYPFGFSYLTSNIPVQSDQATWRIGDLPAGSEKNLTIRGTLTGSDSDLRAFHFSIGSASSAGSSIIGTQYGLIEQDISIQKPFISLKIAVNNDSGNGDFIGQFGQSERHSISWTNNLPVTVSNVKIVAKISGTAYDKASIQPENGYFDSTNNTITWSQQTNPELANVSAGDSGSVAFSVTPRDLGSAQNPLINPTLVVAVNVSGNRTQETNVSPVVTVAANRTSKIASAVALTGRIIRSIGPFTNTGLIPPKSEKATTYTVVWDVDNTSSNVSSAQVSATLPPYVKWLNNISPNSENISYDPNSGLVTWNVGSVGTYTANSSRRREAAFQISLTPSVNQINQVPILINPATLTAVDSFTGSQLQSVQDSLTTRFSTDPSFQQGNEVVQ